MSVTVSRWHWATCGRCGKRRQELLVAPDKEILILRERLADVSLCRACEADMLRERDECPESLAIPGGVSVCRLTWRHEGECEASPMPSLRGSGRTS